MKDYVLICQKKEIELLDVFISICKKHGLEYFLCGGTLIGAMRHAGFIPWDDDIDVMLPKADFKKFLRVVEGELPPEMMLKTCKKCPGYTELIPKIMFVNSFVCEPWTKVQEPSGIFIDIFPIEEFPKLTDRLRKILVLALSFTWHRPRKRLARAHKSVFGLLGDVPIVLFLQSCHAFLRCVTTVLRWVLPTIWRTSPEFATCKTEAVYEDVFPLAQHEFEGRMCNVPRHADICLRAHYGDWTQLPPESERDSKHVIFADGEHAPHETHWEKYR